MKVVHVQGICAPEHGGPTHSLRNYCQGLAARGHDVSAFVLDGFPHTSPVQPLPPPVKTVIGRLGFPTPLGRSRHLRRALAVAETPDVYHLHGAWLRAMHYGAVEARRRQRPYVVEVMGMYEPYSLSVKAGRKTFARMWYQDRILHRAACLHVNSEQEARHLRELGFQNPISMIPVGVDTNAIAAQQARLPITAPWPELAQRPFVLFLSRVHPKKGIELLLEAWSCVAREFREVDLVIAGSGEPEYVRGCRERAVALGIDGRCHWVGQVSEMDKCWLLTRAQFLALPSYSENYGNIVAEALAHGTPVLTTTGTPWQELPARRCGWLCAPEPGELVSALRQAVMNSESDRNEMGRLGRHWAVAALSLDRVISDLEACYKWVIGDPSKPHCVQLS